MTASTPTKNLEEADFMKETAPTETPDAAQTPQQALLLSIKRMTFMLMVFAVCGALLVSLSHSFTRERIAQNAQTALLNKLNLLLPRALYDNDLLKDTLQIKDPHRLGSTDSLTAYRARKNGKPVAIAFMPIAPDGYAGSIQLLVAIRYDGSLLGVRVISHQETPDLGDPIEEKRSPWIFSFNDRSLSNPTTDKWKVKRDGGVFDQFTGATVTPRAVVRAVYNSLLFYQENRDTLFASPAP